LAKRELGKQDRLFVEVAATGSKDAAKKGRLTERNEVEELGKKWNLLWLVICFSDLAIVLLIIKLMIFIENLIDNIP